MRRPTPFVRFLALLCATLQLASPGATAVADGIAARDGASAALSHVESTTTSRCPEIHGVDCAICRYLSHVATTAPAAPACFELSVELCCPSVERGGPGTAWRALPHGRSPPAI